MWQSAGAAVLILSGAATIPFGAWVIAKSRLPHWMSGIWKWPLGDNLSPEVANLQGWASLLVGVAALVVLIPLLRLPVRDSLSRAGGAVAVLFLLVGIAAYVGSIVRSYRAPTTLSGSGPTTEMRTQNALAIGLVAGLVLGALLTADVIDALPGQSNNPNRIASMPRDDGLGWTDVHVGSGSAAANGKVVTIRYTLWLGDGTRIDSSSDRSQPFTFTMGKGQVIKGLDEGVIGMRVGGIRWLTIPPTLAYGAAGVIATPGPSIPPDSTLVMEVELLAVGP